MAILHFAITVSCILLLSPFVTGRSSSKSKGVTIDTFFYGITDEAKETLYTYYNITEKDYTNPLNLTIAMQLSVLSGSEQHVAFLLKHYEDTRALGIGLTFPKELKTRALRTTNERKNDGDVVALRGMAIAALGGSSGERLANIYIFGSYGEPFVDRECTFENPPMFNEYGAPDCNTPAIFNFILDRMVANFEDTELMEGILNADPNITVYGLSGEALIEIDAPVNFWPCAYCFEEQFCEINAINCPYVEAVAPSLSPSESTSNDQGLAPSSMMSYRDVDDLTEVVMVEEDDSEDTTSKDED